MYKQLSLEFQKSCQQTGDTWIVYFNPIIPLYVYSELSPGDTDK